MIVVGGLVYGWEMAFEKGPWQPYRETVGVTLARTGAIAVILGAVLAAWSGGGVSRWAGATPLALWPALGGHFIELWFLNWLRPRLGRRGLARPRVVQVGARVVVWFIGGSALAVGMCVTAMALGTFRLPRWWVGGLGFIGIELVVHLILQLGGKPNFYNGRG